VTSFQKLFNGFNDGFIVNDFDRFGHGIVSGYKWSRKVLIYCDQHM